MTQKDYVINPMLQSRHTIDPELKPEYYFYTTHIKRKHFFIIGIGNNKEKVSFKLHSCA